MSNRIRDKFQTRPGISFELSNISRGERKSLAEYIFLISHIKSFLFKALSFMTSVCGKPSEMDYHSRTHNVNETKTKKVCGKIHFFEER
jgi:hypothetical protein